MTPKRLKPKTNKQLRNTPEIVATIAFHIRLGTPWQVLDSLYGVTRDYRNYYEIAALSDPEVREFYLKLQADYSNKWLTKASDTISKALGRADEIIPYLEANDLVALIRALSSLVNDRDLSRAHSLALLKESYGKLDRDNVIEADVAETIERMIAPSMDVEVTEIDRENYPGLPPS